jgi:hypothetical protein
MAFSCQGINFHKKNTTITPFRIVSLQPPPPSPPPKKYLTKTPTPTIVTRKIILEMLFSIENR